MLACVKGRTDLVTECSFSASYAAHRAPGSGLGGSPATLLGRPRVGTSAAASYVPRDTAKSDLASLVREHGQAFVSALGRDEVTIDELAGCGYAGLSTTDDEDEEEDGPQESAELDVNGSEATLTVTLGFNCAFEEICAELERNDSVIEVTYEPCSGGRGNAKCHCLSTFESTFLVTDSSETVVVKRKSSRSEDASNFAELSIR